MVTQKQNLESQAMLKLCIEHTNMLDFTRYSI